VQYVEKTKSYLQVKVSVGGGLADIMPAHHQGFEQNLPYPTRHNIRVDKSPGVFRKGQFLSIQHWFTAKVVGQTCPDPTLNHSDI
jgi:hypothetical protein